MPPFDGFLGFSQGGSVAAAALAAARAHPSRYPSLASARFAVVAGAPPPPEAWWRDAGNPKPSLTVPALCFVGEADEAVPTSEAEALAVLLGGGAEVVRHAGGHIFPQRAEVTARLEGFLRARAEELAAGSTEGGALTRPAARRWCAEERAAQRDELGALAAIFGDEAVGGDCPRDGEEAADTTAYNHGEHEHGAVLVARVKIAEGVQLVAALPPGYPYGEGDTDGQPSLPLLDVEGHGLSEAARLALLGVLGLVAEEERGNPMVYQLAERAREWLEEQGCESDCAPPNPDLELAAESGTAAASDDESVGLLGEELSWEEEKRLARSATEAARGIDAAAVLRESDRRRGRWSYTVGLVGKPSAGKSTFFNAACQPKTDAEAARVAAFPFTTIAPNVAPAFYSPLAADDPCDDGRGMYAERLRLPVLVKDVAGLVPGAFQGAGKGNAFLNDLCDADTLIHVIDASGTTLSDGAAAGADADAQGDPTADVEWVQLELHLWIYSNVRAKMPSVLRKLARMRHGARLSSSDEPSDYFLQLFVGYHCTTSFAFEVWQGVRLKLGAGHFDWCKYVCPLPWFTLIYPMK